MDHQIVSSRHKDAQPATYAEYYLMRVYLGVIVKMAYDEIMGVLGSSADFFALKWLVHAVWSGWNETLRFAESSKAIAWQRIR